MSDLNKINWRAEALAFAEKHDTRTVMVVQLVELAMKRGAELAVTGATELVAAVSTDLQKKRAAGAPHTTISKPIDVETLK